MRVPRLTLTLTAKMFAEIRNEWKNDSAPGSQKNDLRWILGVGWLF